MNKIFKNNVEGANKLIGLAMPQEIVDFNRLILKDWKGYNNVAEVYADDMHYDLMIFDNWEDDGSILSGMIYSAIEQGFWVCNE